MAVPRQLFNLHLAAFLQLMWFANATSYDMYTPYARVYTRIDKEKRDRYTRVCIHIHIYRTSVERRQQHPYVSSTLVDLLRPDVRLEFQHLRKEGGRHPFRNLERAVCWDF